MRIVKKLILSGIGLACLVGAFFIGRGTKDVKQTEVEIFRVNNQAYLVRVYDPQKGRYNGLEVTDKNRAINYSIIGTDEYSRIKSFEDRNPHNKVNVRDIGQ